MDFETVKEIPTAFEREGVPYAVFDVPSICEITAEDLLGEYPAVRYVPPTGAVRLDLVTRLHEAFTFGDLEIMRAPFEDLTVTRLSLGQ